MQGSIELDKAAKFLEKDKPKGAIKILKPLIGNNNRNPSALMLLGAANVQLKKPKEAIGYFKKALEINPRFFQAHFNLGIAYEDNDQLDLALQSYRAATVIESHNVDAWTNLGNVQKALGQLEASIISYMRGLELDPDFFELQINIGDAFERSGNFEGAIKAYNRAIELAPKNTRANHKLAKLYHRQKKYDKAAKQFERLLELEPDNLDALDQAMKNHTQLGNYNHVLRWCEKLLEKNPGHLVASFNIIDVLSELSDWRPETDKYSLLTNNDLKKKVLVPFSFLMHTDNPSDVLELCKNFGKDGIATAPRISTIFPVKKSGKIKLGYLSGDFHDHPGGYAIADLFENHDRDRFQIHAFSCGQKSSSPIQKRIKNSADHWYDLQSLDDHAAAELIYNSQVEILIDRNGYTEGGRPRVLARKPAPVQIGYMGFPATTGSNYNDYIVADRTVVPEGSEKYFSENIIFLPDSYQMPIKPVGVETKSTSRQKYGLPEKGFVYCCFTRNNRFNSKVFNVWMNILKANSESCLWLFVSQKAPQENIAREAAKYGVSREKLIFAERVSKAEHIARQTLADLFLDTHPYNAHATGKDALTAGLPILTFAGNCFHSRVSASLLAAAGLQDLITYNLPEYEALAIRLSKEPGLIKKYKDHLKSNRENLPIFDTSRYTRNLENAYEQAIATYIDKKKITDIYV